MQKIIVIMCFVLTACSSQQVASTKGAAETPFMKELSQRVGLLNKDNCSITTQALRKFIRGTDLGKNKMNFELQNYLFETRLQLKAKYSGELSTKNECLIGAKQLLSDLRSLEEALGHNQHLAQRRGPASAEKPSLFTDSHRQLVTNSRREERVTSLMDLRTGDVLLLHRVSPETSGVIKSSRSAMDWTDIVVVYKDAEESLFLMQAMGQQVKRRSWHQMSDWLKRSADRIQVLRPVAESREATQRLENRKLKNPHSFGDLIKKEFKIKTSTTLVYGSGETVLGEDLELSPDLVAMTEWKDYSFAYKSRILTQFIQWIDDFVHLNASPKDIKQTFYLDDVITRGVTNH